MNKYDRDYKLTLILKRCMDTCLDYGFKPILLPTICSKDTCSHLMAQSNLRLFGVSYSEKDYGFLRPEGTRLHLSYLDQTYVGEQGFFYWGSMFRVEREQFLRRREFQQFCLELTGKTLVNPELRTVGCLMHILEPYVDRECLILKVNYLGGTQLMNRILESICRKKGLEMDKARHVIDKGKIRVDMWRYLESEDRLYFLDIVSRLRGSGIVCEIDTSLIRGLHYYNGFVFELSYKGHSIVGGGRYDGLWGEINKRKINYQHFGWGLGLTRLVELITY